MNEDVAWLEEQVDDVDLDGIEPYTPDEIQRRMRWIDRRKAEVSRQFTQAGEEEAQADADFKSAYASALISSQLDGDYERKPASFHGARAQSKASNEYAEWRSAQSRRRSLGQEAERLKDAQMSLQSIMKLEREGLR